MLRAEGGGPAPGEATIGRRDTRRNDCERGGRLRAASSCPRVLHPLPHDWLPALSRWPSAAGHPQPNPQPPRSRSDIAARRRGALSRAKHIGPTYVYNVSSSRRVGRLGRAGVTGVTGWITVQGSTSHPPPTQGNGSTVKPALMCPTPKGGYQKKKMEAGGEK